jgi:hypothetical protein
MNDKGDAITECFDPLVGRERGGAGQLNATFRGQFAKEIAAHNSG